MKRVVIVTGAAKGIGKEMVKAFASKGFYVVANFYHSEKQAIELQEELKEEKGTIRIFKADVSKREEVHKLVQFALETFGTVDVLINNAGISEYKLFTEETDEDWKRVIDTNLYSAFIMCQEVLPTMLQKKWGSIINISSVWGMVGASCEVLYSISKAGMDGLTKALAKEVGPSGIRVNSIAPGMIDTEMNQQEFNQEEIQEIERQIPLNRMGKSEEIAKCALWLVENEYITGQVISPNGGWVI